MSKLIGLAAAIVIRLLRVTLRIRHVRVENIERQPQCIQAFWHETILMMLFSRFHRPITVMSSQSRDGDIAVFVYWTFGVRSIRGSSRRGGNAAMREVVRAARGGSNIAMTPDGPTGPPRKRHGPMRISRCWWSGPKRRPAPTCVSSGSEIPEPRSAYASTSGRARVTSL